MIKQNSTILFQGDSITDAGREKTDLYSLGKGYAMLASAAFLKDRPDMSYTFLNKGISGHRIVDLYARWKEDAINLKPDVLSIMIGINDTWHEFTRKSGVSAVKFERVFKLMLDETKEALPNIQLVLIEPFVLPVNKQPFYDECVRELKMKQDIIKKLACEYGAIFVGLQDEFDSAADTSSYEYWSADGIHPTLAGHKLIADKWISCLKGKFLC